MTRVTSLIFIALLLAVAPAQAQHSQPYSGMQTRPLKALSEDELANLKAGRGMGLALAAELNGYPGPSHVLELQKDLGLTEQQRARTQQLFDAMKAEAIPLGERLIAAEAELDRQFATHAITPTSLDTATATIGATQAKLRATHLKYHLSMLDILTPEQVIRYSQLRGYDGAAPSGHVPSMHHRAN